MPDIIISHWTLKISVVSPFLTQGYTGQFGIDTVAARNYQDKIYIPGTLLKGVFRSVLEDYKELPGEELGEMECLFDAARQIGKWLGSGSDQNKKRIDTNEPDRGNVNFADLVAITKENRGRKTLYRISVDDFTGAVKQGNYQVIELAYPIGETVSFEGIVRFQGTADEAVLFEQALTAALSRVPAIGAFKSLGFGRIYPARMFQLPLRSFDDKGHISVRMRDETGALSPAWSFDDKGHISVRMAFDRSVVMSAKRVTNNLFKGAVIFPGSVLKAALAEKIELMGKSDEFAKMLSEVRFSHACPVKKEDQELTNVQPILPYSLYVTRNNKTVFGDYFLDKERLDQAMSEELSFQNDWKGISFGVAYAALGGTDRPDFEMRTRTRIDNETQVAYEDDDGGQLFSYQAVVTEEHDWICDLYLKPAGDFPEPLKTEFLDFLSGHIFQMGKSKAFCEISLFRQPHGKTYDSTGDEVLMTLKTDALLLDIDEVRENSDVRELYKNYFTALGLELVDHIACQKMSGGYLGMRYGKKTHYTPWLLTERGSVFQLKVGKNCDLDKLVNQGLPVAGKHSDDWREIPFIPQNGYGAIVLDMNKSLLAQLNQNPDGKGV